MRKLLTLIILLSLIFTTISAEAGVGIAPKNVRAEQYGPLIDRTVELNWDVPTTTVFATHITRETVFQSIGVNGPWETIVAQRFDQEEIQKLGINNGKLTEVHFHPRYPEEIASTTVMIWTGGTWTGDVATNNSGTLVHTQPVTQPLADAWVAVPLTEAINIPDTGEIWIGINYVLLSGFPMGTDNGPHYHGYGNLVYVYWDEEEEEGDEWTTLVDLNNTLVYNWMIRGRVVSENDPNLNFIGYNVRHEETLLTANPITELSFDDVAPQGRNFYYVSSVYAQGESVATSVMIDVFTGLEPVNPPLNLRAEAKDAVVDIFWDAPEGDRIPTEYRIYKNNTPIDTVPATTFTYSEYPLVNGVPYEFAVRALYTIPTGQSQLSNVVTATPSGITPVAFPPADIITSQSDQNVTVSWLPPEHLMPVNEAAFTFGHPVPDSGSGYTMNLPIAGVQGAAHRFSPEHLANMNVAGKKLVGARFWGGNPVAAASGVRVSVQVWIGGTSLSDPGEMVYEQHWGRTNSSHAQNMIDVGFYHPIDIPTDEELRVVILYDGKGGEGYGTVFIFPDGGTPNYGNIYLNHNGVWIAAHEQQASIQGNTLLYSFAMDNDGNVFSFGNYTPSVTMPTLGQKKIKLFAQPENDVFATSVAAFDINKTYSNTRSLLNYNVYRGETLLGNVPNDVFSFLENDAPVGAQTYLVSAVYEDKGESEPVRSSIVVQQRVFLTTFPHFEGFNVTIFPPQGWRLYSGPIAEERTWYSLPQLPFEGTRSAASASRLGNNMLTPDNWLISPRIVVPEDATSFWLYYYAGSSSNTDFQENYSILVSTKGPEIENFDTVIFTEVLSTGEWTFKQVELTAYAGETIMLAFRHHDVTGLNVLKIDSLVLDRVLNDDDDNIVPIVTELKGNYPNPFNPQTTINFNLSKNEHVTIDVFNIRGQKIRTLVNDVLEAGQHKAVFDGTDDNGRSVSSGVYFYRLLTSDTESTRRMVLMK